MKNLFDPIIHFLRDLGHDVVSMRESGLSGIPDDEVYQKKYYRRIRDEDTKGNLVVITPKGVRIRRTR